MGGGGAVLTASILKQDPNIQAATNMLIVMGQY